MEGLSIEVSLSNSLLRKHRATNESICNAPSSLHGTVMRKSGYIHIPSQWRYCLGSVANEVVTTAENQCEALFRPPSTDHCGIG